MLHGLVFSFSGVSSSRCLRVGAVKQFHPFIDTLLSAKSSRGVFSCYSSQLLKNSSNFVGCREVMATSGSVVTSGDLGFDSLVSSCGNLSGYVKSDVCLSGTSSQVCGRGRVSMRSTVTKCLHSPYGVLQSNEAMLHDRSLIFPAGLGNQQQMFACYSDRASSEASPDNSLSMDQITSLAISVEEKDTKDCSLKLLSGASYLPHPAKKKTGGEDAYFICHDECAIGVADGVGGWADVGVDAGKYARELMHNSVEVLRELLPIELDLLNVLKEAHARTSSLGSSTACIIVVKNQDLNAINLGDSGFLIIRDGHTVFQSPVQQHGFNFPYQLERSNLGDPPSSGQVFKIPVKPGDAIIAGTDGLFDNMFSRDLESIVSQAMKEGLTPEATAKKIATSARLRALDMQNETPFSVAAQQAGFSYYGGKLDDLTVVVSYVSAPSQDP